MDTKDLENIDNACMQVGMEPFSVYLKRTFEEVFSAFYENYQRAKAAERVGMQAYLLGFSGEDD